MEQEMFQETGFTKSKPVIPLKTCYSKTEKKITNLSLGC